MPAHGSRRTPLLLTLTLLALALVAAWGALGRGDAPVDQGAGAPVAAPPPDARAMPPGSADADRSTSSAAARSAVPPAAPDPTTTTAARAAAPLVLRLVDAGTRLSLPAMQLRVRRDGAADGLVTTDAFGEVALVQDGDGAVSLHHVPGPAGTRFDADWELAPWRFDPAAQPRDVPLVIAATGPALVLEVQVTARDGVTVPGATVSAIFGRRDRRGAVLAEHVVEEDTDAHGVARFAIPAGEVSRATLRLSARHRATRRASAGTFVDPPMARGPWTLVVEPYGQVRVRAIARDGAPVADGRVSAVDGDLAVSVRTVDAATIRAGTAQLDELPPGPHRLRVSAGADVRHVDVDVVADALVEVTARFDDDATAVAIAGRVVDADDQGLGEVQVWCDTPGATWPVAFTAPDGAFRFFAPRSETGVVSTAGALGSHRFEPETVTVPFGTTGVVLRRLAEVPTRELGFAVCDAATGQPVPDGGVFALRPGARAAGGWRWEVLVQGRASLGVPAHHDLRWRVVCRGYVDAEGSAPASDAPLQIALERGYERALLVVDRATATPVPGAIVVEPGGRLRAQADRDGRVALRAPTWPERLLVTADGYRDAIVDPEELTLIAGRIELSRLDDGR
ncbi:MAG: hypothetical protein AB7O97_09560 [Planctomycetota bacterium]